MTIIINEPLQLDINSKSHFIKEIIQKLPKKSGTIWLVKSNGTVQKIKSKKEEREKWHTEVIPDYQTQTTKTIKYFGFKKPLITNSTITGRRC